MTPEELTKQLKNKGVFPLYFFHGDNTYKIEEKIKEITSLVFSSTPTELDVHSYDSQVHHPSEIIQSARTLPFFSRKKVLIVKRAHCFKEQWKKFQSYFLKPSNVCVIIFEAENLCLKGALLKAFQEKGAVVLCVNPRNVRQITEFARSGFTGHDKRIEPDALSFFVENISGDAQSISKEVEKAALFCGGKKTVSIEDLEEVMAYGHHKTIFNLVDEIGRGNIEKSLRVLNSLFHEGVYPLVILKMIARQFRLIGRAKEGLEEGASFRDLGQRLNIKYDSILKGLMQQAKGWPLNEMGSIFEEIFQSNFLVKSSRIDHKIILENLVFRLARIKDQPLA